MAEFLVAEVRFIPFFYYLCILQLSLGRFFE